MQYTSLGNWLSPLPITLQQFGIDGQALLQEAGAQVVASRLPTQVTARAWQLAAERSGEIAIALMAADKIRPADWGSLGLAAQHCATVEEALKLCLRYQGFISNSVTLHAIERAEGLDIVIQPLSVQLPGHESMEFGMAAGYKILQLALGEPLALAQVHQTRPTPQNPSAWQKFYHCPSVHFNAPIGLQRYRWRDLKRPLPNACTRKLAHFEAQLEQWQATHARDPWLTQVEHQILKSLTCGQSDQRLLAKSLDISPRHLQRQLKQRQLRFSTLVNQLRAIYAARLLADADRSINDIALQLGFSDHSNFSRAFKRWYKISPSQFRQSINH